MLEAEIRGSSFQDSLEKKKKFPKPRLSGEKLGMVACVCHPLSDCRKCTIVGSQYRPSWAKKKVRIYLQNNQYKRAGSMAQAVEHLPRK
jgi:hypothetical protein